MDGNVLLLLPILLPIVMGSLVLTAKGFRKNRKLLIAFPTIPPIPKALARRIIEAARITRRIISV